MLVKPGAPLFMLEPQSRVIQTTFFQTSPIATRDAVDMLRVKRLRDGPRVLLKRDLPFW